MLAASDKELAAYAAAQAAALSLLQGLQLPEGGPMAGASSGNTNSSSLCIMAAALHVLLTPLAVLLRRPSAALAEHPIMPPESAAQLCAVVAAALHHATAAATAGHSTKAVLSVREEAVDLANVLFRLASTSRPFERTVLEQLPASRLLLLACTAVVQQLTESGAPCTESESLITTFCLGSSHADGSTGQVGGAAETGADAAGMRDAMAAEPAFARVLLHTISAHVSSAQNRAAPFLTPSRGGCVVAIAALEAWFTAATPATCTKDSLQLTAQQVASAARAMRTCELFDGRTGALLVRLFTLLGEPAAQQKAFHALADVAEHALRRTATGGDASSSGASVGSGSTGSGPAAVRVLASLMTLPAHSTWTEVAREWERVTGPCSHPPREPLLSRARWCVARGLGPLCEQQTRRGIQSWQRSYMQSDMCGMPAARCALLVAGLLLDDRQQGAAALAAALATLATHRKELVILAAVSYRAAAGAASEPQAPHCTEPLPADGGAACVSNLPASDDAAAVAAAGVASAASCQEPAFGFWATALSSIACLPDACHLTSPAATILLRCTHLQLLPLALRGATAALSHSANAGAVHHPLSLLIVKALHMMSALHILGMADVTLACGGARLLHCILRHLPAFIGERSEDIAGMLTFCGSVLHAANGSPPWLQEASRLRLMDWLESGTAALQAADVLPATIKLCLSGVPADAANGQPPLPATTCLWQRLLDISNDLRHRSSACVSSDAQPAAVQTSWDRCALATLALPTTSSGCAPPFLGCCYRHCTNLESSSEATLKLKKCGGCRLAR